ncbi:MAG: hypothetical protein U1F43_39090 [Myxococcota bacterium]
MITRAIAPSFVVLALALGPAALAAPGPIDPNAPGQGDSGTPAERARDHDASIDRGFLTPHAETIGAGNWAINSYELLFLGLTYAPSDDFEIALTTSLPVAEGFPILLSLAPKYVFYRSPDTVVAVRGLLWYGSTLGEDDSLGSFSAGIVIDQYLDQRGRFALHASLSAGGAFGSFDSSELTVASGALFELDLGVTLGVASVAKLLVEAQIFAGKTDDAFRVAPVVLLNYGIRFHGKGLAADLGFIRPVGDVESDLILGLPFVAFSARF